jgi:hypothetical protein
MPMTADQEERLQRGLAIYRDRLKSVLEPEHHGKFLVLNLESGDYVVDPSDLEASRRARERFGSAPRLMMRVGYPAAYHFVGLTVVGPGTPLPALD